jgi:hypothetical protein
MDTYADYLAGAERDIASGKRKQAPMIEFIWNRLNQPTAPNPAVETEYTILYNMPGYLPEMEPYEVSGTLIDALNAIFDEVKCMMEEDYDLVDKRADWQRLFDEIVADSKRVKHDHEEPALCYSMPNGYVIEAILTETSLDQTADQRSAHEYPTEQD